MDVVLRCVNKIRSKALNRREFRQFLSDLNEEYGELLIHCEVRWLSKGKVLSRFWALKNSVYLFLSEIDELPTERECLQNDDWLNDVAFLVDITSHLNSLNARLQEKDKLFTNMCDDISAFKMKLHLFIRQLTEGTLEAFPTLKTLVVEKKFDLLQYKVKVESLLDIFQWRFQELTTEEDNVALFINLFVFPDAKICQLQQNLQQEVIDLKCNSALRCKFLELPASPSADHMISFWRLCLSNNLNTCVHLHRDIFVVLVRLIDASSHFLQ